MAKNVVAFHFFLEDIDAFFLKKLKHKQLCTPNTLVH